MATFAGEELRGDFIYFEWLFISFRMHLFFAHPTMLLEEETELFERGFQSIEDITLVR